MDGVHSSIDFHLQVGADEEQLCNDCGDKSCKKTRAKSAVPGAQADWQNEHQVGNVIVESRLQQPPRKQGYGDGRDGDSVVYRCSLLEHFGLPETTGRVSLCGAAFSILPSA